MAVLLCFFTLFLTTNIWAQKKSNPVEKTNDSIKIVNNLVIIDTFTRNQDSILLDSLNQNSIDTTVNNNDYKTWGIVISPDALSDEVIAEASDSAVLDRKTNKYFLYGNAKVDYTNLTIGAGKIIYDQQTGTISAVPEYDTNGAFITKPTFTQGSENFTYDSLHYNFNSKRAIVRNARTQYGEGFVFSNQVKRNEDQSIYGWQNVYTTCDLDEPHFGIRAKKIKVVPGKLIASGPANVVIEGVPTPAYLPFGIFPIQNKQTSGFIMPTYTVQQTLGMGFLGGGYYFYLNRKNDLSLITNIYTKGSWGITASSNYNERYKYSGNVTMRYMYEKQGETYEPNGGVKKSFFFTWRHNKDAKSRPGINFSADVNFGTSDYFTRNSVNANQIVNNNYQSNITYQKVWQNKPYSLTVALRHDQNTQSKIVNVTIPELTFFINPQNILQRKIQVGQPRWYEKITFGYTLTTRNMASFIDSTFNINKLAFNDFRTGISQAIPISASYNVLKYFNLNFNAQYNEYWLKDEMYVNYNETTHKLDSTINRGFFASRDFNASSSLNTRIFGLKKFKSGWLQGIRHEIKPDVTFSYRPDFGASPFNYNYQSYTDSFRIPREYSRFVFSPVGQPPLGKSGTVSFGIGNNLQIKTRSKNDTTGNGKNISIFDNLSIRSGYNMAVDSFNWDGLNLNFMTNILQKVSINGGARWDYYHYDDLGKRTKEFASRTNGKFANFQTAFVNLSMNFHSKKDVKDKEISDNDRSIQMLRMGVYEYVDFNIPWNISVNYGLTVNKMYHKDTLKPFKYNHNLIVNGDFNVTDYWKFGYTLGYDFKTNQISNAQFNIYRDLHCWAMQLSTVPFGPYRNFTFTLNAKANMLKDAKITRRRNFRDAIF